MINDLQNYASYIKIYDLIVYFMISSWACSKKMYANNRKITHVITEFVIGISSPQMMFQRYFPSS